MRQPPVRLSSALMTLFHLTNMNVFAVERSGIVVTSHEPHVPSGGPIPLQTQSFRLLSEAAFQHPERCHFHTNAARLTFAANIFDDETAIIAGPFLIEMPDLSTLRTSFQLDETFIRDLPLMSRPKQQSLANILHQVRSLRQAPISFIEHHDIPNQTADLFAESANVELVNLRYELNNDMMHAIEHGNAQKLLEIRKESGILFDFSERFPNRPVRATKNMMIILNTTFRIAAERGGVPPFLLHQLSEKFALAIERIDSINALTKLSESMGAEYCTLVKENELSRYSQFIQRALRYLHVHLKDPFDAQAIADSLRTHPSHLARQFKKETNMTMTAYLQHLRIKEAKRLLKKEHSSIDWIAGAVGFEDASYFARVFKKITGQTPSDWRNDRTV
ncbi:AraC family transcriptional regulator [Domibacillus aminovorans]|uniref:HTH araC/xylS-type domain-containing protein n=1 Tax=Domibacillus aminovorans TaxID=29332 RepID=A0A177L106_9BACI|nr:AraC family transcriptional regulator [Domibacillus aminovorans]OAH58935.1 hypothetical protein AWH49_04520 [Domibacillus aminovorans]